MTTGIPRIVGRTVALRPSAATAGIPRIAGLTAAPRPSALTAGLKVGDEVIGAVGVFGAPGGDGTPRRIGRPQIWVSIVCGDEVFQCQMVRGS